MTALTESAFRKSLKNGAFERVYYFYGDDDFLKARAVDALVQRATEPAIRAFNLDARAGADLDPDAVDSLLGTPPMMADRRVVVVRDVGALRKGARAVLDRYLAHPAPDLVLVLVATGGERARVDRTLADRAAALEFPPLSGERVAKWIVHEATTTHGVAISAEAVALLHQAVGNDLPALSSELDKLVSFTAGGDVDDGAVAAVVGVRRGETLGDLLDRVGARDAAAAMALLPHILEQPKTSAVSIVMALTTQTLALAWGLARPGRADYFAFLKSAGGVYVGRPWGDAASAWAAGGRHWTRPAIDRALAALLAADIALKESRVSTDLQLLSTLVLSLCAPDEGAVPSAA